MITRSAWAASAGSCVTITSVAPSRRLSSSSSSSTCSPVLPSRLPVGSSASRIGGLCDERAGERDALLFAAGKLHRIMVQAIRQADSREQFPRSRRHFRTRARQFGRQQDVLFGRQSRNQLEGLKNETDFAAPDFGHAVFGKPGDIFSIEQQLPAGGIIEAGEQAEQTCFCRFPKAP